MYACIYCDPDFSCTRTYIQPEVVQEVLADLKMHLMVKIDPVWKIEIFYPSGSKIGPQRPAGTPECQKGLLSS